MDVGAALIDALGLRPPALVALVGGGGKSTLVRGLHAAGTDRGWRCGAGTTTKVGAEQFTDIPGFLRAGRQGAKWVGVTPDTVDACFATGEFDLLAVEADGSRSKVVKAPAEHEPVIPSLSTHVVAVMGADAIDRVIEDVAHRPMLVGAVCGCGPYERLTAERAARLLTSRRGGRKAVPPGAAFAVALTRIGPRQQANADRLARLLADSGVVMVRLPRLS